MADQDVVANKYIVREKSSSFIVQICYLISSV